MDARPTKRVKRSSYKAKKARISRAIQPVNAVYAFNRISSVNTQSTPLYFRTDASGRMFFSDGSNLSANLQISFSLQETIIYLGGTARWTVPTPNYTEFTALFDQFRIKTVDVMAIHGWSGFDAGTGTVSTWPAYQYPSICYCADYDDVLDTGATSIQQYSSCKYIDFTAAKPVKLLSFTPRTSVETYRTAVTTAYTQGSPKAWIDIAYPNTPQYGLKLGLENSTLGGGPASATVGSMNLIFKYHLEFKNPR